MPLALKSVIPMILQNSHSLFQQLTSLCLKVDNTSGFWGPNLQYGGSGCEYDGSQGTFSTGVYQQVNYNHGILFNTLLSFPGFVVSVRDVNDPYIQAQEITQGSMNFGLTKVRLFRFIGIHIG